MIIVGQIINLTLLILLVALTWIIPRRLGFGGVLVVQCLVAIGFIVMGGIALATGIWPTYEDGLVIFGLLLQAFLLNCVLLPLAGVAVWRHRRSAQPTTSRR